MMPSVEIIFEREAVTVATLGGPVLDPQWTFIDAAGHEHDASLESLRWVVTRTWWCQDCRDEHEEGEYRCVLCGEVIEPGTVMRPPETKVVPGRSSDYAVIDGTRYYLTPEQIAAYQESGVTDEWLASLVASS